MKANQCYDVRFVEVFLCELARRGHPAFPTPQWFSALESADREAPCTEPMAKPTGEVLWDDESTRVCGYKEPRIDEGKRWWCYSVARACDAFWRRRYG